MSKVKLVVNPAEAAKNAVLIHVSSDKLGKNPYRDMDNFPIQEAKLGSLVESIEQTGFWPSIVARPKGNMVGGKKVTEAQLHKMITDGVDLSEVVWEKAFGHHRHAACEALDFATIPVIPRALSEENMIQMFANENKAGFGSNINSQLETVRQVKAQLEDAIDPFDDFEAYKAAQPEGVEPFFKTAAAFKAAQDQGIGFRTIKKFLGETWKERDVRAPAAVLGAIDDGLFAQADIVNVPSIGLLEGIANLTKSIMFGWTVRIKDEETGTTSNEPVDSPDWPMYFKNKAIADIIAAASVEGEGAKAESRVTVSILEKAKTALRNNGANPGNYVMSGKGGKAFDVYDAIKNMVILVDVDLEANMAAIRDLAETDGFSDWEGLSEIQLKLITAAEKLAKGDDPDAGDVPEGEEGGLPETTEGNVDAAINEAMNGEFGEIPEGEDGVEAPIAQLIALNAGNFEQLNYQVAVLIDRNSEVECDEIVLGKAAELIQSLSVFVMLNSDEAFAGKAFREAKKVFKAIVDAPVSAAPDAE